MPPDDPAATSRERAVNTIVSSVRLDSGITLELAEQGDASGLPVVLLHGLSDSWCSFGRLLPHLPPSLRVLAPSLRGHGDSDRPHAGYRPQDMAADVAHLLDALGVRAAIVAGHSMGSAVAQRLAIDHADRVLGLVLIGAMATWRGSSVLAGLIDAVAALEDPIDARFVREFQESTLARPVRGAPR
jgi:non-heme chloroperoxidase